MVRHPPGVTNRGTDAWGWKLLGLVSSIRTPEAESCQLTDPCPSTKGGNKLVFLTSVSFCTTQTSTIINFLPAR